MNSRKISFHTLLLVCMIVLNFLLPRLMPGGPIAYLEGGGDESAMIVMTQEQQEKLLAYYDIDKIAASTVYSFCYWCISGGFRNVHSF